MYPSREELFHDFSEHHPEGKLELIDGKLIVGNSLVGSRLLLRQILQGWKADAAVALAPIEIWIEAIKAGFNLSIPGSSTDNHLLLDALDREVQQIAYQAEDLAAGWGGDHFPHDRIRQDLTMALFAIAKQLGGQSLGRDFVMRLGNNGFTPDLIFFKGQGLNRLFSYYLDGPAELVIEILRPGHEYCDRVLKRQYYEATGVPEYWILNPSTQQTEFWRWNEGQYQQQFPDNDGFYRPHSVPGLAFRANLIWQEENWYNGFEQEAFVVETSAQPYQKVKEMEGPEWGSLPFQPQLSLSPTPIRFEEYISWCPEAKFEFFDGKPQIGYKIGTKHVLGMLMMTFGLVSAVQVLPPQTWIAALRQRLDLEQQDAQRKAAWWQLARQAAERLHNQFGLSHVGAIGDLVRPQPLNYWSEITLVTQDADIPEYWKIYDALSELSKDPEIRFIRAENDYLTVEEKEAIAQEMIQL
ncbi:MAG: Uma2 family endonuclease [Leptolyngbyaceae cyanobacterium RM2_2_4]|nr:Uma2 family endonuclease [Leptolyngbyaceae cyanobacterium SM1_4_3]NJO49317.1 Uma2 family endonuclease [Leptolyngbyaceae cyanobacterium RM2_2_4]NJO66601.1 Uma2 family endonuclease [Leptolyngbyaceae cyanobacterium RM1_405_57]